MSKTIISIIPGLNFVINLVDYPYMDYTIFNNPYYIRYNSKFDSNRKHIINKFIKNQKRDFKLKHRYINNLKRK